MKKKKIEPVKNTIEKNSVDEEKIVTESTVENIKNSVDEEEINIPIIVNKIQPSTKEIPELSSDNEDDEASGN